MGVPRVFISSTCYDLAEIRDSLVAFCEAFGFETALSERGDVFYHPDLHTHESCVGEVSNCHLLILIIGGRFGGEYVINKSTSITNAEYSAARTQNVPVFTFIKQDVLNDHNVWQRNKAKSFASDITYPSIDKQDHAEDIFKFIDLVRHSEVNNGFFGFRYAKELHGLLRKQVAGMFFDFLTRRNISKQVQSTNDAVTSLTVVSNKIEDLVKRMYLKVTDGGAAADINEVDREAAAEQFFVELARVVADKDLIALSALDRVLTENDENWQDAIVKGALFQYGYDLDELSEAERARVSQDPTSTRTLTFLGSRAITDADGLVIDKDAGTNDRLIQAWEIFRTLPTEIRKKILSRYAFQPKARVVRRPRPLLDT